MKMTVDEVVGFTEAQAMLWSTRDDTAEYRQSCRIAAYQGMVQALFERMTEEQRESLVGWMYAPEGVE